MNVIAAQYASVNEKKVTQKDNRLHQLIEKQ